MTEPQDVQQATHGGRDDAVTLTDEQIETRRVVPSPRALSDTGDDTGDTGDVSDTSDTGDTGDTGDDAGGTGDAADTTDTGDDTAARA